MTTPDKTPTQLGVLVSELFIQRLRALGLRSSTRLIVDYLPDGVGEAAFDALLQQADTLISAFVPPDGEGAGEHLLYAISGDAYNIVPFLVVDPTRVRGEPNRGSEGFASSLRDHFAAGDTHPRVLVVITRATIETQKSAQDASADRRLVTLPLLLDAMLDVEMVATHAPLRAVARAYCAHRGQAVTWDTLVEDFQAYLDRVADQPPEVQGEHLPMLKCFLKDARPDFADGERVKILEDKVQRQRQRGEERIFDNALIRAALTEAFEDPMVEAETVFTDIFEDEPEQAKKLAEGGAAGLQSLDLGVFAGMEQKRLKRQKNQFIKDTLSVEGAVAWQPFGQGANMLLVVTSPGSFTVKLPLLRTYDPRKEHAMLVRWDTNGGRVILTQPKVEKGAHTLQFQLEPDMHTGFSVCQLLLARGKRTIINPIDTITVAVYFGQDAELVVEEDRKLSLEAQAWVAEGKPRFSIYRGGQSEPAEAEHIPERDGQDQRSIAERRQELDGQDQPRIVRIKVTGSALTLNVIDAPSESVEDESEDGVYAVEELIEQSCSSHKVGYATTLALKSAEHYLDAVQEIHEGAGRYRVDLARGNTREISASRAKAPDPFIFGRAVARLLHNTDISRLERRDASWSPILADSAESPALVRFREARVRVMSGLREIAEKRVPRFRRVGADAAVPLALLPLHSLREDITAYLAAYSAAIDESATGKAQFGPAHDALLQTDTLRVFDASGDLERLVVLPSHPWLLATLLAFQDRCAENIRGATEERAGAIPKFRFALTPEEVSQLVPRTALEHWYVWHGLKGSLHITDSAPFHLEFLPEERHIHRTPLDYVGRVVANKVGRYLRMHPHLRDHRRSLRIGFVNPGDGEHLLSGLKIWLRNVMREHAGRIRELPMDQIPAIELHLFARRGEAASAGSALTCFFQEQVGASDEDGVRQTLAARTQYRVSESMGPASARDEVHICFVHGLVNAAAQQDKSGTLGDGWDGGFGDGLLSTWLRHTAGAEGGPLHSRRGLWIDGEDTGLRGALARMLALQRGCRFGDIDPKSGIFWECALPSIADLKPTYEHSDWVVHLDRELSLEIFRRGTEADRPRIIEYSDQEVPESPGYDTITVTRNDEPYREQLGEILTTADLDLAGRSAQAQRAANQILDDINALSGSWALDFLLGSIADERMSTRLKGNVGAALAYRWLLRREMNPRSAMVQTDVGEVVPVVISLEDLLRATPAAGLSKKDGLVYRYTNELPDKENKEAAKWCDDLLVLYLTLSERGTPSQLYGRVIEVKFGSSARQSAKKAVEQVRGTQELLSKRLAGDSGSLDAPFRHKQLSLLIKAQLEQAVAMGAMSPEVLTRLNLPALSANLATGRYSVDYEFRVDGQHIRGDAFLLDTSQSNTENMTVEIDEGVRLITIPRKLVEWLAFEQDESPTLTAPLLNTMPRLGKYRSVQTNPGLPHKSSGPISAAPIGASPESPSAPIPPTSPPPEPTPPTDPGLPLEAAVAIPVKAAPYPDEAVVDAVKRLERALLGHKVRLTSTPSARETDRGPRLLRAYVRLEAGESIGAVRRISEDIARVVGTATSDIHITNVPERHAVGLDLPLPGLTYAVSFDDVMAHVSWEAAQRELRLGFCAGIDVTGKPVWVDLATMPHMLVAGTTGSGKTVFLRNLILTLLLNNSPRELVLRLSSSKPMDFRVFTQASHCGGRDMARDPSESRALADELVEEMERRYGLFYAALCEDLGEFNAENPQAAEPFIVAVFDEYAEMIASFPEKSERDAFEGAIGRLAQKARAAGIHLVVCMQRPDAIALKGAIKANILHRFALKLPQNQDSRVILDEGGAETLLGQGDMLYKDANSRLFRLQVPFLENSTLKRALKQAIEGGARSVDPSGSRTCPKCGRTGPVGEMFGTRRMKSIRRDGTEVLVERPQSYCKTCRSG